MTDTQDTAVEQTEDNPTMGAMPLLVGFLVYGSVALSLYLVTGRPHVGNSYPVAFAIGALLVTVGAQRRWPDAC